MLACITYIDKIGRQLPFCNSQPLHQYSVNERELENRSTSMFNISFAMGMSHIKNGRNAHWVQLFLIDFEDFSIIYLIF